MWVIMRSFAWCILYRWKRKGWTANRLDRAVQLFLWFCFILYCAVEIQYPSPIPFEIKLITGHSMCKILTEWFQKAIRSMSSVFLPEYFLIMTTQTEPAANGIPWLCFLKCLMRSAWTEQLKDNFSPNFSLGDCSYYSLWINPRCMKVSFYRRLVFYKL